MSQTNIETTARHSSWVNEGSVLVECGDCDLRALKSQAQAVFIGRTHVERTGHRVWLCRRQTKAIVPQ